MSNPNAAQAPVTVIGLGLMGHALAAAFLKAGHPTTVWNRTPGKAEQLVAQGAILADTVEKAVAASPLVVVCVTDNDALHEHLDPLGDLLQDRVLLNLNTGTSAEARETAEWAAKRNGPYLQGVIMCIPPVVATDGAVFLYSGPKELFDEHESTLQVLAPVTTLYLGEDHALSPLHDMAILTMLWGLLNSFLHGAALLGTAGVKATTFAPLLNTLIHEITEYVTAYAAQIDEGKYPADDATNNVHQRGIENLIRESEALGINSEMPRVFKRIIDGAVADGHAESSYAALVEQFRKPSS